MKDSIASDFLSTLKTQKPLGIITILLFSLLIKWILGLNPYSGYNAPPLYGDYEAQRHWLEITNGLDQSQWYRYDLEYWGLDYPPLTAWHSLVLGKIAHWIQPAWIALDTSRGNQDLNLKIFMRWTVILSEMLIFVPAVVGLARVLIPKSRWVDQSLLILLMLTQPCLNLIDHGHFQYNAVMLGFSACALYCFFKGHFILGGICFCLSLMFKQMALFYALPIFFYLLGQCRIHGIRLFIGLALSTVTTFAISFFSIASSLEDVLQILHRVFPVARGLYEDKVANFWCASNVIVKLRSMFSIQSLLYISLGTTLIAVLPWCFRVFSKPTSRNLILALISSSLGFFLFSFQVHEKSILIPAFMVTLLYHEDPLLVIWFNNVAVFSMLPLLIKDGLGLISVIFALFWTWIAWPQNASGRMARLQYASYSLMASVYLGQWIFGTLTRYPDLYTLLNLELSVIHFLGFWVYWQFLGEVKKD